MLQTTNIWYGPEFSDPDLSPAVAQTGHPRKILRAMHTCNGISPEHILQADAFWARDNVFIANNSQEIIFMNVSCCLLSPCLRVPQLHCVLPLSKLYYHNAAENLWLDFASWVLAALGNSGEWSWRSQCLCFKILNHNSKALFWKLSCKFSIVCPHLYRCGNIALRIPWLSNLMLVRESILLHF